MASHHYLDGEAGCLVECHVANAPGLCLDQIVATGKAAVRHGLPWRLTIEGDMTLEHRRHAIAVGRIAGFDYQIEDHAASAGGEIELVAVFGVAAAFDDDIGYRVRRG
jgi:hypothetical protein